jgi:hypothetical protein
MKVGKKRIISEKIAELKNNQRWGISLGFTMVAIGYNLSPVKGPIWLLWFSSILIMGIGAFILYLAFTIKTDK